MKDRPGQFKFFVILLLINVSQNSFTQSLLFSSYKVKVFSGHRAKLIIKGNPLAEMYKSAISESYNDDQYIRKFRGKGGLNFASHYCFVYWGCGSDCQHGAIADLKTGKIYDGPTAANLFVFKAWSRLLIVNRPEYKGSCAFSEPEYWILNEKTKRFVKIK